MEEEDILIPLKRLINKEKTAPPMEPKVAEALQRDYKIHLANEGIPLDESPLPIKRKVRDSNSKPKQSLGVEKVTILESCMWFLRHPACGWAVSVLIIVVMLIPKSGNEIDRGTVAAKMQESNAIARGKVGEIKDKESPSAITIAFDRKDGLIVISSQGAGFRLVGFVDHTLFYGKSSPGEVVVPFSAAGVWNDGESIVFLGEMKLAVIEIPGKINKDVQPTEITGRMLSRNGDSFSFTLIAQE